MTVLSLCLVLLGLATTLFIILLFAARILQRFRARSHVGRYRVRIGPASGNGRTGSDLGDELNTVAEARERATSALVAIAPDDEFATGSGDVAFILAARDDGGWDVVDRIDVL